MSGFFGNIQNFLIQVAYRLPVLIIALTFHEFSHAWVAYRLGDGTAKARGRLTLNPLKHLDPIGSLMILLGLVGWARPVPVNSLNFKNPKQDMVKVGLAGPLSNLLLAFVIAFPLYYMLYVNYTQGLAGFGRIFYIFLGLLFEVNLYLAIFNLLPVPPLDGSRIFYGILPEKYYFGIMKYERYIVLGLFALIILFPAQFFNVLNTIVSPIHYAFMKTAEFVVGLFI